MKPTVLIVGAGVVGCNLAHELTRRRAAVTIIDAAQAGSGTSAATFAWVNANNKSPTEYAHLNFLGLQAHQHTRRSLTGADWFHQTGNLEIAQDDGEMAVLDRKVERLTSAEYQAKLVSTTEIKCLEPSLRSEAIKGGVLYPKEGWIDTWTMCSDLLYRACEKGAVFRSFERITDLTSTGAITTTPGGSTHRYAADVTILAAGNGTRSILARAGITFPTLDPTGNSSSSAGPNPTIGLISTTSPVDSGIRHVVHAEGIAMRPARNGGITLTDHPTGSQWNLTDPRIWTIPDVLLERARRLYPSLAEAITQTVSLGTRVLPEDGVTIADWVEGNRRLYAVATHSGVTLSAHLANAVAQEVLTGERHSSLRPFGLTRFAR